MDLLNPNPHHLLGMRSSITRRKGQGLLLPVVEGNHLAFARSANQLEGSLIRDAAEVGDQLLGVPINSAHLRFVRLPQ